MAIWRDINTPDSPLYHERDFGRVLNHARSKATQLAAKRKSGDAGSSGSAPNGNGNAPDGYISRAEADRLVAEARLEALRESGALTADTGRPSGGGAGGGSDFSQPAKSMDEARQRSLKRLEEAARA